MHCKPPAGFAAIVARAPRRLSHISTFLLRGLMGSLAAFLDRPVVDTYFRSCRPRRGDGAGLAEHIAGLLLFALQMGPTALILRQMGRPDGLVPYMVADNWATFFTMVATVLLALSAPDPAMAGAGALSLVLIIMINIARLIVTLVGWQIVGFLAANSPPTSSGYDLPVCAALSRRHDSASVQ